MSNTKEIPTTEDPDEDLYPHYYSGEPSAHVWSTLVYCDEIDLEDGVFGVGPHQGLVSVDIEGDSDLTSMGMSVELSPEDARKAARSLILSAELAENTER